MKLVADSRRELTVEQAISTLKALAGMVSSSTGKIPPFCFVCKRCYLTSRSQLQSFECCNPLRQVLRALVHTHLNVRAHGAMNPGAGSDPHQQQLETKG